MDLERNLYKARKKRVIGSVQQSPLDCQDVLGSLYRFLLLWTCQDGNFRVWHQETPCGHATRPEHTQG